MIKRIYLSGQCHPKRWVYIKFMIADFILCMMGYEVYNPRREKVYFSERYGHLHECTHIFFVPGWKKSPLAKIEFKAAVRTNKKLIYLFKKDHIRFEIEKWEHLKQTKPEFDKDLRQKFINALRTYEN